MINFAKHINDFIDPRFDAGGLSADGEAIRWPQIRIQNFPRHVSKSEIDTFFNDTIKIPCRKFKTIPGKTFVFVYFNTEEDMNRALEIINKTTLKGNKLEANLRVYSADDRDSNKRNRDSDEVGNNPKLLKTKNVGDVSSGTVASVPAQIAKAPSARDSACPWWNIPYAEQLQRKTDDMNKDCLYEIVKTVKQCYNTNSKQHTQNRGKSNLSKVVYPNWVKGLTLQFSDENSSCPREVRYNKHNAKNYRIFVNPIKESPELIGYRNKCEFTFGTLFDTQPPEATLGFRCSSYSHGTTICPPYDCINIPNAKKLLVKEVIKFMNRNDTRGGCLGVYDTDTKQGGYRLLTTRYSKVSKELVVMLCVNLRHVRGDAPTPLTEDADISEFPEWLRELSLLSQHLASLKRPVGLDNEDVDVIQAMSAGNVVYTDEPLVTGFLIQVFEGLSVPHSDHPVIKVFGQEYITEKLLDCKFQVSPQSFFQVNTPGAEVLYETAIGQLRRGDKLEKNEEISNCLLDVCCGTGTIGLVACRQLSNAKRNIIIGVDCCETAIVNANVNTKLNNIASCVENPNGESVAASFVCSKAEAVLGDLLASMHNKQQANKRFNPVLSGLVPTLEEFYSIDANKRQTYAIVDPPREGMHPDCLRAIRNCTALEQLIYISCNPKKSLIKDCMTLCGPGNHHRQTQNPFRPTKAFPIDLFPHTPHCEMIVVFERVSEADMVLEVPRPLVGAGSGLSNVEKANGSGADAEKVEAVNDTVSDADVAVDDGIV